MKTLVTMLADCRFRLTPFVLALAVALLCSLPAAARAPGGATVLLDAWYNSQTRKNPAGLTELYHYKWNDTTNSGYSLFGQMWRDHGVATETLTTAPTLENLKDAQYYLIVSPDNPAKNPNPHFMDEADAFQVAQWVKSGGVSPLMENDPANADIEHLDLLAGQVVVDFTYW